MPHFPVSHFSTLQFCAAFSIPAFSSPAFFFVPHFHVSHFQSPPTGFRRYRKNKSDTFFSGTHTRLEQYVDWSVQVLTPIATSPAGCADRTRVYASRDRDLHTVDMITTAPGDLDFRHRKIKCCRTRSMFWWTWTWIWLELYRTDWAYVKPTARSQYSIRRWAIFTSRRKQDMWSVVHLPPLKTTPYKTILREHLLMRKVCARWVPRMLDQKMKDCRCELNYQVKIWSSCSWTGICLWSAL